MKIGNSANSQNISSKIRFPIRITVPLALLVFVAAATSASLYINRKRVTQEVIQEANRDLRWTMTNLVASLERAARNGDAEAIQEDVAALGANPAIMISLLIDENTQVLASNKMADIGKPLSNVLPMPYRKFGLLDEEQLNRIKTSLAGKIEEPGGDGRFTMAIYPVVLGTRMGEVRPSRIGNLIVLNDLASSKARVLNAVNRQAFGIFAMLAAFSLALALFFHYQISERLRRLVEVANELGTGKTDIRSGLRGRDEIAQLARAVDRMVTDRIRAEQEQLSLGRILDESFNEIYIFDVDTLRFLQVNRGATDNLGYSTEELRDLTPLDLKPEFTREKFLEKISPLRTEEAKKIEFETVHRRKDGSLYNVEVHLQTNNYQGRHMFVAIILDITERKRAEQERARMNEELEQRVDERTRQLRAVQEELLRKERLAVLGQLAGSVAHELRNPLGVLKNAVYYIEKTLEKTDNDTTEAFEEIERALKASDSIISELLDYAGEPKRNITALPIPEIIDRVLRDITVPSSIKLRAEIVGPGLYSQGDRYQIERLLFNLIQNAIQAMPKGGTLTLRGYKNERNVVLEITDTGVGISTEKKEKIFQPLYSDKVKGIGLGLSIAKRYAELNKGELNVDSEESKGSTFRLMLPLGAQRVEEEDTNGMS